MIKAATNRNPVLGDLEYFVLFAFDVCVVVLGLARGNNALQPRPSCQEYMAQIERGAGSKRSGVIAMFLVGLVLEEA